MSNDPIQQILSQVEEPVEPRSEFAEPLLRNLLDHLSPEPRVVATAPSRRSWGRRASALLRAAQRRPWRTTAGLAAFLLFGFLLNFSAAYFAPTYGLALANAPLLGAVADPVLRFSGLNPAQVTAVDESVTSSGHTIKLLGGYADSDRTVLVVEVDGQHPLPNKKQTCCSVQATLQDQFLHSYSQGYGLDTLTLSFDPLAAPASQVGARLTLHVTALQPLMQPENMNPQAIAGDWSFHVTLIQNAVVALPPPAGGTANGVAYRFTSARLSGLRLTVNFTVSGPAVEQLRESSYPPPSPGTTEPPPGQDFGQRYILPDLVDAAGNAAQIDQWGFAIPREVPAVAQASFIAELPKPGRYTLTLGRGEGAFTVEIEAP
jgi:hypothetical protein